MEKIKELNNGTLNFTEQIQNQIQICRESITGNGTSVKNSVDAFESMIWFKLSKDKKYISNVTKLEDDFKSNTIGLQESPYLTNDMKRKQKYKRKLGINKFKEIMNSLHRNKCIGFNEGKNEF